ncbi:MAG: glycosyltransferase family 4 protein [Methanophagales archaeon]|nr:glycosyltransferase family 4 protein [Methanophagales archaeon]
MEIHMLYEIQLEGKKGQNACTTHTIELFEKLKKIENEVNLFVPKPKDTSLYKQLGILYLPLNIPLIGGASYQLVLLFYYLLYQIKHRKPDVIHSRISLFTISPMILSKLIRVPYIVEINGLLIGEQKLSNTSRLIIQISKVIERFNYKHATKLVAVTQGIKEGIMELYNIPDEKIVVIENGANTDLFKPMDISKARKGLKFDQDANYICFVGHLVPWQGVEYLIQSAPLILKEIANLRFLIVGDGPKKKELVELAEKTGVSDDLIFTGAVPYEEVPKYINASDVCVAPFIRARNERIGLSPLKIYEYLACEKSIVSSRIPNLEFIEEQNAGILVEPENPEELAKAIIKLLKDEKLREEMGKNGREYVVKNHSWESVARRVVEACESTISIKNKSN